MTKAEKETRGAFACSKDQEMAVCVSVNLSRRAVYFPTLRFIRKKVKEKREKQEAGEKKSGKFKLPTIFRS